jgi:branched-chain amino acid transport system ATP-binding protein
LNSRGHLALRPSLLLLDEPVAGMNLTERGELAEVIRNIRDEFGMTVLLVEHDMSFVMGLCDEITVMNFGRKIAEGTPERGSAGPAGHPGLSRGGCRRC